MEQEEEQEEEEEEEGFAKDTPAPPPSPLPPETNVEFPPLVPLQPPLARLLCLDSDACTSIHTSNGIIFETMSLLNDMTPVESQAIAPNTSSLLLSIERDRSNSKNTENVTILQYMQSLKL